ncbi:MAG: helix-hairpin-helix domain-containing protein, partial [Lachnospiraceae bacterium]|nr:helix-hairpin-helix domain-containing protein [Lachnospiraceae bacterium]
VCGAVVRSGVYELADGARVADALEMAGGFSPDADREWVNLARTIVDGERLAFYTLEQTEELKEQGILCEEAQSSLTARTMSGSQPQSGDEPIASSGSSLVNLNTATKEELMSLPGIGETRAEAVLRYRQQQGPFQSIEEIMQIRGIKESVFASIRDLITV